MPDKSALAPTTAAVPFTYALACHSALADILAAALAEGVARGVFEPHAARRAFSEAVSRSSAELRSACDRVLAALDKPALSA